jgi:amino acid transporter
MMIFVFPVIFIGWKLLKRTTWKRAEDIDLYQDLDEIEEYTRNFIPTPPKNAMEKWFNWLFE